MATPRNERHLTTGDAALLLRVSQQTVIKCFDAGILKGHLVPGSRFRRIPAKHLIRFAYEQGYTEEIKASIWAWLEGYGMLDDLNELTWREFERAGMLGEISASRKAKLIELGILKQQQT